jgi:4-hydroxybenzoate polyprenyltransferase
MLLIFQLLQIAIVVSVCAVVAYGIGYVLHDIYDHLFDKDK